MSTAATTEPPSAAEPHTEALSSAPATAEIPSVPQPATLPSPSTDVHESAATGTTSQQTAIVESRNDDGPPLPPRNNQGDVQEDAVDPRVASLQPMFPDFDATILHSVLESVGWDQDRAVDTLLGMNDPDYVSQHQSGPPAPSQTDLDEQLARRLMLEEEQEQQAAIQRNHQWSPSNQQSRGRTGYSPPQGGEGAERDTMAEVQEQFNKVAEVGKKTFTSIVSKVKAKMQEFDQSMQGQGSSAGTTPNWGGTGSSSYPQAAQQPAGDRHSQQAYYAPNPYTDRIAQPVAIGQAPPSSATAQGYDVSPNPTPQREAPSPNSTNLPSPSSFPAPHSDTPRPPATQTGPPTPSIDPSKIGLLPKRPVSLVRDQHSSTRPRDDDDELEYVENPFEDRK